MRTISNRTMHLMVGTLLCVGVVGFPALTVEVRWSVAVLDENTASRYQYDEWPLGIRTGYELEVSPLEKFVRENSSKPIVRRWRKTNTTGKNIIGESIMFACGPDSPAMSLSRDDEFEKWISRHSREEVFALHKLLTSGDREAGMKRVRQIDDEADSIHDVTLASDSIRSRPRP